MLERHESERAALEELLGRREETLAQTVRERDEAARRADELDKRLAESQAGSLAGEARVRELDEALEALRREMEALRARTVAIEIHEALAAGQREMQEQLASRDETIREMRERAARQETDWTALRTEMRTVHEALEAGALQRESLNTVIGAQWRLHRYNIQWLGNRIERLLVLLEAEPPPGYGDIRDALTECLERLREIP